MIYGTLFNNYAALAISHISKRDIFCVIRYVLRYLKCVLITIICHQLAIINNMTLVCWIHLIWCPVSLSDPVAELRWVRVSIAMDAMPGGGVMSTPLADSQSSQAFCGSGRQLTTPSLRWAPGGLEEDTSGFFFCQKWLSEAPRRPSVAPCVRCPSVTILPIPLLLSPFPSCPWTFWLGRHSALAVLSYVCCIQ